jgi:1-deoxy-D-xylulose-5-phosphate reductoisomerase
MKRLIILGSTGSIGRQALDVVDATSGEFEIVGLGARRDARTLAQQAQRYRPKMVALVDPQAAADLRPHLPRGTELLAGADAMDHLASTPADLVLVAIVGTAGLAPTLAAFRAGTDVALANKETLVAAGSIVMDLVRRTGRRLFPVDSEHAAIAQCLRGESPDSVRRILLTGSGGPLLRRPLETLKDVMPEDALAHPTWKMGKKITVDSATLMNKGLEVIEARWLFDVSPERIEVVIHPQSIVHSMVEFVDGSVKAQLAPADMRLVIAYALRAGERAPSPAAPLPWAGLQLTFERPDPARYPCLGYAYEALRAGGTMPAVLNAANEVAVQLFLDRRIAFHEIASLVARAMDAHRTNPEPSVEEIFVVDAWAREHVRGLGADTLRT